MKHLWIVTFVGGFTLIIMSCYSAYMAGQSPCDSLMRLDWLIQQANQSILGSVALFFSIYLAPENYRKVIRG